MNYEKSVAGFSDENYRFAFAAPDDQLLKKLVGKWNLKQTSSGRSIVGDGPEWWPANDALQAMPAYYERQNDNAGTYHQVWVDRESQKVYLQYGNL